MTPLTKHVHAHTVPAAMSLLPPAMASPRASAMLLAIGLQESKFAYRRQVGGPARGFWQFEQGGGVAGVLGHETVGPIMIGVCGELLYQPLAPTCHEAIEHNDVLACAFARLLLWTDARPLPDAHEAEAGWAIYVAQWRPGKPRPGAWTGNFGDAWSLVLS